MDLLLLILGVVLGVILLLALFYSKEISSEIEIESSAEQVWQHLTDFESFPEWNPFIRKASGKVKAGERIEVFLQLPESKGMTFRPKLLKVEPNRELRWLGRLVIPRVFDGEHIFTIEEVGEGRVRFFQREKFRGFLAPLFLAMIKSSTLHGFEEMNKALKERAE
ncbi:MAG: SRPBCC family protein [Asgard group archaeon]